MDIIHPTGEYYAFYPVQYEIMIVASAECRYQFSVDPYISARAEKTTDNGIIIGDLVCFKIDRRFNCE